MAATTTMAPTAHSKPTLARLADARADCLVRYAPGAARSVVRMQRPQGARREPLSEEEAETDATPSLEELREMAMARPFDREEVSRVAMTQEVSANVEERVSTAVEEGVERMELEGKVAVVREHAVAEA